MYIAKCLWKHGCWWWLIISTNTAQDYTRDDNGDNNNDASTAESAKQISFLQIYFYAQHKTTYFELWPRPARKQVTHHGEICSNTTQKTVEPLRL